MRFPVKFNRSFWRNIPKTLPSAADPRILCHGDVDEITFTRAVSTFKFGATFKSTQKARFPHSILELSHLEYGAKPIILDVGASDGSTSLDVMRAIPFEKYYVIFIANPNVGGPAQAEIFENFLVTLPGFLTKKVAAS
ncbi:MAG: hypothetical protein NT121_01230 [Chloroflexi bacterium]|nr:hypothetical protein [Chloroflexota bacterium]